MEVEKAEVEKENSMQPAAAASEKNRKDESSSSDSDDEEEEKEDPNRRRSLRIRNKPDPVYTPEINTGCSDGAQMIA